MLPDGGSGERAGALAAHLELGVRSRWDRIDRRTKHTFLILFVVSLLAWGAEVAAPTFNVDDYGHSLRHEAPHWTKLGRWAADVVYYGILGGWFAPWVHLLVGLVLNVAAVMVVARMWCLERARSTTPVIVACSLFLTFPYFCDAYSFNTGQVQIPLANLLAATGYAVAGRKLRFTVAGAGLIMLGLALYQVSFNFIAVAVVVQLLLHLVASESFRQFVERVRTELLLKMLALPLGVALYGGSLKVAFSYLPERNSRWSSFSDSHFVDSPADAADKLVRIWQYAGHHLLARDLLLPTSLKLAIFAVVLVAVLAALVSSVLASRAQGPGRARQIVARVLTVALLTVASFVCVYGTDLATTRSVLGTGYRHTYPMGILYAGFFMVGVLLLRPVLARHAYLLLGVWIVARFVLADNVWSFNQQRLNEFDAALASRIVTRIENHPEFTDFKGLHVALVGLLPNKAKPAGYSTVPEGKSHSSLHRSVFQAEHSKYAIFRTLGLELEEPSKKQWKAAKRHARKRKPWPHRDSVTIKDDLAIVVLGPGKPPPVVKTDRKALRRLFGSKRKKKDK